MATLSFTYETGIVPLSRIVDAFALQGGYEEIIDGLPNPETKAQFARRTVRRFIMDIVRAADYRVAEEAARAGITDIPLV